MSLYRKVQPHYFEKQQIINKAYECTVFERYLQGETIKTLHTFSLALIHDVRINHRFPDIAMSKQFLQAG